MQSCSSGAGIKACGSGAQCHCAGGWRGSLCSGVGGERPLGSPCPFSCLPSPPPLFCISPALLLPSFMPLKLCFPSFILPAAVGCAVGPWGPWSGCSSPCGVGSKARSRQVTIPPRHGGEPCPDLKQRRGCLGEHPTCRMAKEVAKILPDSFNRDFRDPWRRAGLLLLEEPSGSPLPSYCGYFRLTQVGPPCRGQAWSRQLHQDKRVCVECRGDTSHRRPHCTGHGLQGARTFWVAASVAGCQGSWVQEELQEGCVCPPPALIFV
ncbi:somatomedin-B and thrombospondin type-1 domain-containing protein-like isoform 1-T1 [Theristicus caerulescens]